MIAIPPSTMAIDSLDTVENRKCPLNAGQTINDSGNGSTLDDF